MARLDLFLFISHYQASRNLTFGLTLKASLFCYREEYYQYVFGVHLNVFELKVFFVTFVKFLRSFTVRNKTWIPLGFTSKKCLTIATIVDDLLKGKDHLIVRTIFLL